MAGALSMKILLNIYMCDTPTNMFVLLTQRKHEPEDHTHEHDFIFIQITRQCIESMEHISTNICSQMVVPDSCEYLSTTTTK